MKKISKYMGRYWYGYLFAVVCIVLTVILNMIYPKFTQSLVDDVIVGGDYTYCILLLLAIGGCGIGRFILQYAKEYSFDYLSSKIAAQLRKDLFNHIQTLSMDFFDNTNTGELMARVKDDVDKIWNGLGFVGMLVIEVTIHVGMVLYFMFSLNWRISFIPLCTMIACGVLAVVLEKKMGDIYERISEENAELTTVAEENLAGVRTVKAFAREDHEISKFLNHNRRYYNLNMEQSKVLVRYYPYFQIVGILLPIVMTIVGGTEVMKGRMTIGMLVAYVEYSSNCTWPMEMIGWLSNELSSSFASFKKVKKIFEEKSTIELPKEPIFPEKNEGKVQFKNVGLTIEGKEILKDVSFCVEQGKTLGIMGATGSGKTTIVNLCERFVDPTSGSVYLGNDDVKLLDIGALRRSYAVVFQDVFLFSDSIDENIRMGNRKNMTEELVKNAAHMASASFIEKMEEGYETVIGERGVGLSGGQKQRISIARALSKQAPILIMDDSTSALDMETEKEIQKMLDGLKNVTKIIVAHRISAVKRADEIIILDEGVIKERGTHSELLKKKGLYYETYVAQYGAIDEGSDISVG